MIFTSISFIFFFPIVIFLFYATPSKYKWITLLVASYYFYVNVKPVFALLVAGVTLVTYLFTTIMEKTEEENRKKILMQINIILIILPLFFFKYFSDINDLLIKLLGKTNLKWPLPEINLILPVGISFYTFMAIGYIVDVYNEKIKAEKNIGILALFISFFPLILSGPIERAKNMIPQFRSPQNINYLNLVQGLKLMLWGYFMKLVVADRVGIYINSIFKHIDYYDGATLLFANILYPLQMYADFGGYSLIAIGVAKALGFNVMQNFMRPFFATSMSEFWRRWHISLISWLTDYIYTPLSFAFRKFKIWGIVIAIMITFMFSGIWHGAALTFIVWGLIQGFYLSIEVLINKKKSAFEKKYNLPSKKWYTFLGIFTTFILFTLSQLVGRAKTMEESIFIIKKIFYDFGSIDSINKLLFFFSILGIIILFVKEFFEEYYPKLTLINNENKYIRFFTILTVIILIVSIGVFDGSQFIYFQF